MDSLLALLREYGLLLVFANVFAEQAGLPVPAIPTLVVSGALAADGHLALAGLVLVALAASLLADYAWYLAGRRYGYRVLKALCRISLNADSCVSRTEALYTRWGAPSLLLAKFVPGFSTVAPPLSGALGVSSRGFILFDGLGALVWIAASVGAGFLFHRQVDAVLATLASMGTFSVALLLALLAAVIARKSWQRHRLLRQLRMDRVTVEELEAMLERGEVPVIVDVRSPASRAADPRAIPGAIAVDGDALATAELSFPLDRELVVYCNCPNEASAAKVAQALRHRGYRRVRPLLGDSTHGPRVRCRGERPIKTPARAARRPPDSPRAAARTCLHGSPMAHPRRAPP